ncbi:MAG: M42 family peptidase, partial [Candidatus Angelobacter sp.]
MKIWLALVLLFSSASFAQSRPSPSGDETQQLLQALADAPGPSGFEEPVRKIMVERMKPLAEKLSYDGLGSVIAVQGTSGPRIMVDAHMDELGGMVRRVSNDGYLTMQMLGGWLDQALVDQRWIIIGSKGPVRAITGIRDIHILPQEERTKVFPRDSIFLDVGAKNAAEVAAMGLE